MSKEVISLANLSPAPGANRKRKRVGRGPGSGHGKTAGRGHKGKGARSGGNTPPGYEGGQMPLQRRIPKRGFRPLERKRVRAVNVSELERRFEAGEIVDSQRLLAAGLIRRISETVKILGKGTLTKPLVVRAAQFSAGARRLIEAAGGTVEVV